MTEVVGQDTVHSLLVEFSHNPLIIAITTAVVSVGLSGYVGNWLAHKWQLRAKRYEVVLHTYTQFQSYYVEWFFAAAAGKKVILGHLRRVINGITQLQSLLEDDVKRSVLLNLQIAVQAVSSDVANGDKPAESFEKRNLHAAYSTVLEAGAAELGIRKWNPLKTGGCGDG